MSIGLYEFTVADVDDGITVKSFLRRRCGLSARSMTVIKYDGGSITRNGDLLKAHDILYKGDIVRVELPRESCDIEPVPGNLDILYEDDHLLIVNKPPSMPVHPTKIHQLDTLANIVSFYQQSRGESYTFRALNRLDKDTSGCVLIAKDRITYSIVKPSVKKTYIAVCEGMIEADGTVDAPIALSPDSRIRRCISDNGAAAVTHYYPVSRTSDYTICSINLETGRTHQIRCHMSFIGHPLAGDDMYGGSLGFIQRQALHCSSVEFVHPVDKKVIRLTADTPDDIKALVRQTRN